MDQFAPGDVLRVLDEDVAAVESIRNKLMNQIHHLQVEADLFQRQLKELQTRKRGISEAIDFANEDTQVEGTNEQETAGVEPASSPGFVPDSPSPTQTPRKRLTRRPVRYAK